jgi:hypothetical protein
MTQEIGSHHVGRMAANTGQRVKAVLTPLEDVCGYREQVGEDTAIYTAKPREQGALPFSISIAPGGINIETSVFMIKELPIDQADFAVAMVEAIVNGRVRLVRRVSASGKTISAKAFVFGLDNRPLYKQRRSTALAGLKGRGARHERVRIDPYSKT